MIKTYFTIDFLQIKNDIAPDATTEMLENTIVNADFENIAKNINTNSATKHERAPIT